MSDATEDERKLRMQVMQADLDLKRKQGIWETPRNIAILVTAVAAIAGVLGFRLGREPPQAIQIQVTFPPGTVIQTPAVKP